MGIVPMISAGPVPLPGESVPRNGYFADDPHAARGLVNRWGLSAAVVGIYATRRYLTLAVLTRCGRVCGLLP
jgi:hypothetical protein